ncbi:MAG: hypothetical protein F6J98_01805 [Moorea sp. SIO4G2]|nr:hypothetical protein [Moorena sp. SIO4G2]NEO59188.1 hypothetical protein [Moorena sp. SIO4G2]
MTDLSNLFDQALATASTPTPPQSLNDVSKLIDQEIKAAETGLQLTPFQKKLNSAIKDCSALLDGLIEGSSI